MFSLASKIPVIQVNNLNVNFFHLQLSQLSAQIHCSAKKLSIGGFIVLRVYYDTVKGFEKYVTI
jgi:hypothetical protein